MPSIQIADIIDKVLNEYKGVTHTPKSQVLDRVIKGESLKLMLERAGIKPNVGWFQQFSPVANILPESSEKATIEPPNNPINQAPEPIKDKDSNQVDKPKAEKSEIPPIQEGKEQKKKILGRLMSLTPKIRRKRCNKKTYKQSER